MFVAAEFAVVLDEAADYRVKVAFGGDVEVHRGAAQVGNEGKALQRIALFDGVVGPAAGCLHGLRQEGGFFEFGIGRAAVVGEVGKQGSGGVVGGGLQLGGEEAVVGGWRVAGVRFGQRRDGLQGCGGTIVAAGVNVAQDSAQFGAADVAAAPGFDALAQGGMGL